MQNASYVREGALDGTTMRQIIADVLDSSAELEEDDRPCESETELLIHFVHGEDHMDLELLRSKSTLALTLWYLSRLHRENWSSCLRLPLNRVSLLNALIQINANEAVSTSEAMWVEEKFMSVPCEEGEEETKLLLCVACWYSKLPTPTGSLSRVLLLRRLELEQRLYTGVGFFFPWAIIFGLYAISLIVAGSVDTCRGIKGNLESQLLLNDAELVTSPSQIHSFAKKFSERITYFAPISSVFFPGSHSWLIQDQPKTFSSASSLPYLMEPEPNTLSELPRSLFLPSNFTMQAWVSLSGNARFDPDAGLSLLTKSLAANESLKCWSWRFPPQLRFGAHDYGPPEPNNVTGTYEELVRAASYNMSRELSGLAVLHTLRVSEGSVTFMVDDRELYSEQLPRPVTDCLSTKVELGDGGLTLASVKFYPRELKRQEVAQIFSAGLTWKEIAHTAPPQRMRNNQEQPQPWQDEWRADRATASQYSALAASVINAVSQHNAVSQQPAPKAYSNEGHEVLEKEDATLGSYWLIHEGPVYTSPQSRVRALGTAIPQHDGDRGFTVSSWVNEEQEGYLLSLAADLQGQWRGFVNMCWAIYVSESFLSIYAATAEGGHMGELHHRFTVDASHASVPEDWRTKGSGRYRHFAFSIDPSAERPFRICINGKCSGHASIDAVSNWTAQGTEAPPSPKDLPRPAASCRQMAVAGNETVLYMSSRPVYEWPFTGWQMQTKYFDRVLSDSEVMHLFNKDVHPQTGRSVLMEAGCKRYEEAQDEHSWRDVLGHSCVWYRQAVRTAGVVCEGEVLKKCPRACGSLQLCWGEAAPEKGRTMRIWKRQMFFTPRGPNGTMCVAKSTTAEKEALSCASSSANAAACLAAKVSGVDCKPRGNCSGLTGDGLLACLGSTMSWFRGEPVFPCSAIVTHASQHCAWDDAELPEVRKEAELKEAWSLGMWFEGTHEGCVEPNIRFLRGGGRVLARVGVREEGLMDERDNSTGQWRGDCRREAYLNLFAGTGLAAEIPQRTAAGRKRLLLLGTALGATRQRRLRLVVDEAENDEFLGEQLPLDLKVINVQGSVVLSPMELRPSMPARQEVGEMLYDRSLQENRASLLPPQPAPHRDVSAYMQRTMLLVPPFMLLKRFSEGNCTEHLLEATEQMQSYSESFHCWPYECHGFDAATTPRCASDQPAWGKYFGQRPLDFMGEDYYMEFLGSLTSGSVIGRKSEEDGDLARLLRRTEAFVDALTSKAKVMALFYTPEFNILTWLSITFDTTRGRVHTSIRLYHATQGDVHMVMSCLLISSICCFVVIRNAIHNLEEMRSAYAQRKHAEREWGRKSDKIDSRRSTFYRKRHFSDLFDFITSQRLPPWFNSKAWFRVFDICLAATVFVLGIIMMLFVHYSTSQVEDIASRLMLFFDETSPGSEEDFEEQKGIFLRAVSDAGDTITDEWIGQINTVVCLAVLCRIVYTTSDHPRMKLITRTLELARTDLIHFAILMIVTLGGFTLIGQWMFGEEQEDFRTVSVAIASLLDSIMGPPGNLPIQPDGGYSLVGVIYVVLFHMVCFFFLLNFLLAMVVDNYTMVVEEMAQCTVDQSLPEDIFSLFHYSYLCWKYRFPLKREIIAHLSDLKLQTLTVEDLQQSDIFCNADAAAAFFNNYARYPFLGSTAENTTSNMTGQEKVNALMMQKVDMVLERLQRQQDPERRARSKEKPLMMAFRV